MLTPELSGWLERLRDPRPGSEEGRSEALAALEAHLESAGFERDTMLKALERAAGELESRVQELSLLRRLSEVLTRAAASHEIGPQVMRVLRESQEIQDAALWVAEGEELEWRCGMGRGEPVPGIEGGPKTTILLGEGLVGQAAVRAEAVVVHDGLLEGRCQGAEIFLRQGSFCLFPLLSSGRLIGVLWLGSAERYAFPTERLRVLTVAAGQIA